MTDLFETPEKLPKPVRKLIERLGEEPSYKDLARAIKALNPHGYTFDYYLDATPYNLRKI